ncbi:uncharacterized protein LOC131901091 [Peromyscus eremicus]|uniref:uncharacterized protein LOC131901091 n=1 Tax=Peromyscus eremicus TaxID=42410 RepID=UPI0027DC0D91|nr:uncharacterized protein LOC131901091 [Peromyscus eremicus]
MSRALWSLLRMMWGSIHLNAHHYQGQGFGRKSFFSHLSIRPSDLGHGTKAADSASLTSIHSCLPFCLVSILEQPSARYLDGLPVEARLWMSLAPVFPALDDVGQHPLECTSPRRPRFWKEALLHSHLNIRLSEHGTGSSGPPPWSPDQCTQLPVPFPCVHPGAVFCQSLHPVTDGSRYRDPQPSIRPSSRSQLKRGNKNEEDGVRIMMGKSTETTGPCSWKLMNFRPTAVEPSWDYTTLCMREKHGLFEGPLAVGSGSIPGA